jgi:ketosteroid isomerase-like protein
MSDGRVTIERFVEALAARDLAAALALYEPEAVWEVHVPGGDGYQQGIEEIADLLDPWFTGRDGFEVARYRVVDQSDTVALQWELHWRDKEDGAPCISHQSHFFEVQDGRIHRHWLYCSGVRVYELEREHDGVEHFAAHD